MPFQILWQPRQASVQIYGEVIAEDIVQATRIWQAAEAFDELRLVIYDFSRMQSIEPLTDYALQELDIMSIGAKHTNGRINVTVILPDNPSKNIIELAIRRLMPIYPIESVSGAAN